MRSGPKAEHGKKENEVGGSSLDVLQTAYSKDSVSYTGRHQAFNHYSTGIQDTATNQRKSKKGLTSNIHNSEPASILDNLTWQDKSLKPP